MPTTFGMVMVAVLVVGMVAGLALWVRAAVRRRGSSPTSSANGVTPYDENRAAAEQTRTVDRNGWA